MLHEDKIIETLIDEDDKRSSELNFKANNEIGSWVHKKELKTVKKLKRKSSLSSVFRTENLSRATKQSIQVPNLPQITYSALSKNITLASKVNSIFKKANIIQKKLELEEIKPPKDPRPLPYDYPKLTRGPNPPKDRSLKAAVKPKRENFSVQQEIKDSPSFLFFPTTNQIKFKKVESVGYYSSIYEKYFPKCESITSLQAKSEAERKKQIKNSKSKKDVNSKNGSLSCMRPKKTSIEGSKIMKKFLLSPIYQNICKYNSAFLN